MLGVGTLHALEREGLGIIRSIGSEREFRHDQMRAFLAALWLVEETPTLPALQKTATDAGAFGLNRRDQEELWGFVAPLLTSAADLEALWRFANDDPIERAILLGSLAGRGGQTRSHPCSGSTTTRARNSESLNRQRLNSIHEI